MKMYINERGSAQNVVSFVRIRNYLSQVCARPSKIFMSALYSRNAPPVSCMLWPYLVAR